MAGEEPIIIPMTASEERRLAELRLKERRAAESATCVVLVALPPVSLTVETPPLATPLQLGGGRPYSQVLAEMAAARGYLVAAQAHMA